MAGDTEYRLSARDSFWTWRQSMYTLANRVEPEDLQVHRAAGIRRDAQSGLYRRSPSSITCTTAATALAYASDNALWEPVRAAASQAGIGLTLLPTLYQTSDFGAQPLRADQARFDHATDDFRARACEASAGKARQRGACSARAPHSTACGRYRSRISSTPRATCARSMRAVPLHIHVAEQVLEVDACVRDTGARPIELLLRTGLLDAHWCLVHATHATPDEIKGMAATGVTVCVSITTEANLGDGFFDALRFLKNDGRLCIGSDSQSSVNPAEELRWLEYQQRLRRRKRGVLASNNESHIGTALWRAAALAGASALGQPAGTLAVGRRADWLVLDPAHPALAGGSLDTSLDRLLFAGGDRAIRDVMVGGRWAVRDGRHAQDEHLRGRFGALLARLGS